MNRLMVPDRCLELAKLVVDNCEHCTVFAPVPRRPTVGAELAGHAGDCLVVDLFYLWGAIFLRMIDEAVRFKVSSALQSKDAHTIAKTML